MGIIKYRMEEIPYKTLEKFGLSQSMVEDLPDQIQIALLSGCRSPLLSLRFEVAPSEYYETKARIRLVPNDRGELDVLFTPKIKEARLDRFSPEQQEELKHGKVIFAKMNERDGSVHADFYQLDMMTNQLLSVPSPIMVNNLNVVMDQFNLEAPDAVTLRSGEPLEVKDHRGIGLTVGTDLTDETGFRIVIGDKREWLRQRQAAISRSFDFGLNGCWMTDKFGEMSYVKEEDYTPEILEQMRIKTEAYERNRKAMTNA